MAVTSVSYVGDGSTTTYSITFPYIASSDIVVTVSSIVATNYTYDSRTRIRFTVAPADGAPIKIRRATEGDTIRNVFYPGSAIRARDLNDNFDQSLYIMQEATNSSLEAAQDAAAAAASAAQASIDAAQAQASASSAQTDASNAQAAATAAQSQAADAQSQAASANSAAISAQAEAVQAQISAALAEASANQASIDSQTAALDASLAQTAANVAQASADYAQQSADAAAASAQSALDLVETSIGTAVAYDNLYNQSAGAVGSKTIDFGDLTVAGICAIAHFPGENLVGTETYTMLAGCSSIDYGSV